MLVLDNGTGPADRPTPSRALQVVSEQSQQSQREFVGWLCALVAVSVCMQKL